MLDRAIHVWNTPFAILVDCQPCPASGFQCFEVETGSPCRVERKQKQVGVFHDVFRIRNHFLNFFRKVIQRTFRAANSVVSECPLRPLRMFKPK